MEDHLPDFFTDPLRTIIRGRPRPCSLPKRAFFDFHGFMALFQPGNPLSSGGGI